MQIEVRDCWVGKEGGIAVFKRWAEDLQNVLDIFLSILAYRVAFLCYDA